MKKSNKGCQATSRVANPEMYQAMLGKRTSGAAGYHGDKRLKRLRTRGAQRRAALADYGY